VQLTGLGVGFFGKPALASIDALKQLSGGLGWSTEDGDVVPNRSGFGGTSLTLQRACVARGAALVE